MAKSQSDRDLLLNDPKAKPKKEENDDEKKEKKKKDEDDEKQTAVKKERMKIKDEEMANQLFKDIFALNDESMGILERIERSADDAQAVLFLSCLQLAIDCSSNLGKAQNARRAIQGH